MRVIIADDAGFIRELVGQALKPLGVQIVAETANGPETIQKVIELKPDMLFLDLVLPELNGIEVAKEVLSHFPGLKIVVLTSLDPEWIEQQVYATGCHVFVLKPFTQEVIVNAFERAKQFGQEVKYGGV